jgi:hypothetical protein
MSLQHNKPGLWRAWRLRMKRRARRPMPGKTSREFSKAWKSAPNDRLQRAEDTR